MSSTVQIKEYCHCDEDQTNQSLSINELCPICHNEFFSENLCDIIENVPITVPVEDDVCLDDLDELSDEDLLPSIFAEILPIPENLYLLCDENEF